MEWEDIPINKTEVLYILGRLNGIFTDKRKYINDLVWKNYSSFLLQLKCNMTCKGCHPIKVLECWEDNKTENTLHEE